MGAADRRLLPALREHMGPSTVQSFVQNSLLAFSTKIVYIVAGFVTTIAIANHLGPSDYGRLTFLLDFLLGLVSLLGIASFSEALTVFTPKTRSRPLVERLLLAGIGIGTVLAVAAYFFPFMVLDIAPDTHLSLVRAIAILIFFNIVSTLLISALIGSLHFGKVLVIGVIESVINTVLVIAWLTWFNGGMIEIVYAKIFSLCFTIAASYWYFRRIPLENSPPDWQPVYRFTLQSAISNFVKRLSTQSLLFFLGTLIAPIQIGLYYLIQKIGTYLVDMPATALSTVLLPTASQQDPERAASLVSYNVKLNVILSVVFSVSLLVIGPFFVGFFFPRFAEGVDLIPFFAAFYVFSFDLPLATFFRAINRNHVLVATQVIWLALTVVLTPGFVVAFGVRGILLSMILNRIVQLAIFYADIRRQGYPIEFWPRPRDLVFFNNNLGRYINRLLGRM